MCVHEVPDDFVEVLVGHQADVGLVVVDEGEEHLHGDVEVLAELGRARLGHEGGVAQRLRDRRAVGHLVRHAERHVRGKLIKLNVGHVQSVLSLEVH